MKKKSITQTKDRMIHIRLDERVHRELKIFAVKNDTTIQALVEGLITNRLATGPGAPKGNSTVKGQE